MIKQKPNIFYFEKVQLFDTILDFLKFVFTGSRKTKFINEFWINWNRES